MDTPPAEEFKSNGALQRALGVVVGVSEERLTESEYANLANQTTVETKASYDAANSLSLEYPL